MYTDNRDAYRQTFYTAWQKYLKQLPLEPVEAELAAVIAEHPEYHAFLAQEKQIQKQEFALEENPFFHLSLHVALREQIKTDRPAGIKSCFEQLCTQTENKLAAEHQMINILVRVMHKAYETGSMDDADYLKQLTGLLSG